MEIRGIPRNMFNETKGKELVHKINQDPGLLSKYVALSCAYAVNQYLETNRGEGILEQCTEAKYHFFSDFLNLDMHTCVSLNLFGEKNSLFCLFRPITNMGKCLLKRRINQPSSNLYKIEKWYENLK